MCDHSLAVYRSFAVGLEHDHNNLGYNHQEDEGLNRHNLNDENLEHPNLYEKAESYRRSDNLIVFTFIYTLFT